MTLSVCGTPGDYLCVTNTTMSGLAIPLTSEYEEHTIELENGTLFDYLTFYTSNAFPFFINYISVDQDLKKGDKALISNNTIHTNQNYFKFNGLNEIDDVHSYAYTVYGIHKSLSKSVYSPRSEIVYIDPHFTGINEMDNSEYSASAHDGGIIVETRDDVLTRIFSADGVLINEFHGSALTAVPNGVYLVNANGKTIKLMVH